MENSNYEMNRRRFIKSGLSAGMLLTAGGLSASGLKNRVADSSGKPVRIGFVGVGGRGMAMLKVALMLDGVEVPAVCDIVPEKVEEARRIVEQAGQSKPKGFTGSEDYKKMAELNNLDAIFTATPWRLHTPVMVAAMKGGKHGGTEMPACDGIDEAWELVETAEQTGMHCMLLENYAYMRNVMMVLNMVRGGAFGELTHCETGYQPC